MGTQQSKDKQTPSTWTSKESDHLETNFQSPLSDAPSYFSPALKTCILSFLKDTSKSDYLQFMVEVVHGSGGLYSLFHHAVQTQHVSLYTFVSWLTITALPLWFSSSGYPWPSDHPDPTRLIEYFLHDANQVDQQRNESMAWLEPEKKEGERESAKGSTWKEKTEVAPSAISQREFEDWIRRTPTLTLLFARVMAHTFTGAVVDIHKERVQHTASPEMAPHGEETLAMFGKDRFSDLLTVYDYFLITQYLPRDALSWTEYERQERRVGGDVQHKLLFSSRRDGMSWQNFVGGMIGKGSTVIVIKAKDGSVFGGYADERWECGTEWYGNSSNFLFRLTEGYGGWPGTTANGHYQYLCWGKKTLPNGMGLGGQFEYAGLWMETDFMHGHSRGGPLCTTFDSPRLSREENFLVDEVEVWLVKPLKRDENEEAMEGGGVLSHAQDMEFMEMAGKKMYSKNLGPDASGKHKA